MGNSHFQFRTSALGARLTLSVVCTALFVTCAGCGKSPYDLAAARGNVTVDGKPVTQARVMFAPLGTGGSQGANAGKPSFGILQNDGTFVLGTYGDADGAIVGPHSVTIIANPDPDAPALASTFIPKFKRMAVPGRFLVEAGKENQFSIAITQQDVAKYGQK